MAIIRGRYISLTRSSERRIRQQEHLQKLGLAGYYSWFPAISGDPAIARQRKLLPGEWGLWQSWLSLLREENKQSEATFDWLHVIEDDAELSPIFLEVCKKLKPDEPNFDLLFTDMYVNPSIHRFLAKEHQRLKTSGNIRIETDLYTGCASSVLIHRNCIPTVLRCLQISVNKHGALLPLDNQLRRLVHTKQLRFARTAPFLTCVQNESIEKSTIQKREKEDLSIVLTQKICTNLRRQLSVLNSKDSAEELIQLLKELSRYHDEPSTTDLTTEISLQLMNIADSAKLFRYGQQPRLAGEPDNPQ